MRTSETITKLAAALAKAQAKIADPTMSGEGQVGGGKTAARKYPYALLTDVLAVARVALGDQGIFLLQAVDIDRNVMLTRLVHSSGEWLETDYPMAPRNSDPQRQGSANTYARRYALMTILGIAGERDDDGAGAAPTGKLDPQTIRQEGSDAGRAWMAREYLAKAVDGYSGGSFAAKLKKAKIPHSLEHVKIWCLWMGKNKPSRMKPEARDNLVGWLGSAKGKESWSTFVKSCGPLPRAKKKAAQAAWTKVERDAFTRRLKELEYTLDEVGRWCLGNKRPHPSQMDEETRGKLLAWLESASGGDTILAWLETQQNNGEE